MKNLFTVKKKSGKKISMITCYDYTSARLLEKAGVDTVLVGDSLGMTMLGYDSTLEVTMEDMIHHARAVKRGLKNVLTVVDLPFMSYQNDVAAAVNNAGRLVKEGKANIVKLEGGEEFADVIKAITRASIPVCAHIGLTPQSINAFGGFVVQGRDIESARKIVRDALAVEKAGAVMVVLGGIPTRLAEIITKLLKIPTVGIGAGNVTDGQVLVMQDLLGLNIDFKPKFVKHFMNGADIFVTAFKDYISEIETLSFPGAEHEFALNDEIYQTLKKEYL